MEVSSLILGLIGIGFSIVTFIITYKQTIGARRERAKNVIHEVNKMLYRNLILEEFIPTLEEINRILSSKILEYRIKESDLPADIDFLNTLYTRLVEDELIETKIKNKLISKIDEKIKSELKKIFVEEPIEERKDSDTYFFFVSAILSMMIGMLAFLLPLYDFKIPAFDMKDITMIISILFSMIVALLITQNILKQKDREVEESSPTKSRFKELLEFENKVYKKIKNSGFENIKRDFRFEKDKQMFMIDFFAQKNKTNYYFEVKHFRTIAPTFILERLGKMATDIKERDKKAKLVLITKDKIILNERIKKYLVNWDYIIDETSLNKLKDI